MFILKQNIVILHITRKFRNRLNLITGYYQVGNIQSYFYLRKFEHGAAELGS